MKKPCDHTRGGSRADGTPICIKCGEVLGADPDREPVGQAVNSMLLYLEQIACMTLMPETFAEVAAEEENLKDAVVGLELILRIIKARKSKLRVVK